VARARLERDGDVGVLVPDGPPLNLFGREMVSDLLAALDETDSARALLIRAEGDCFTGGADVNVFDGLSKSDAERFTAELMRIIHRMGGAALPDARAPLFETEDLRGAVKSFLSEGPGKATFGGR
jgi:enoyl-CoA hydratase/carnithine racemase